MFFTQDDYKKIQQWLTKNSVKDTEFNEASIPFNGEEIITIVQGNQNKKVFLKDLIAQVFNLGISDFVNITDKYDAPNISLEEAIRLIPSRARKEGQVITFLDMEDHWHIYQFKGVLNQWNVLDTWEDLFDWEKLIINSILPDEEDLTKSLPDENGNSYLSLKDREYNPEDFSGLGRIILRKNIVEIEDPVYGKVKKNILYQDMFTQSNTIYEIRYDFDLNEEEVVIPKNCILKFNGGKINNGTLIGNNTSIVAKEVVIFNNINILGVWCCKYITSNWFEDVQNENKLKELINLSSDFINNYIYIANGHYVVQDLSNDKNEGCLKIKSNTTLRIDGTIKINPNPNERYSIILINGKNNVKISGSGSIIGDRDEHTGRHELSEWGYCLCIRNSRNILVDNIKIKQAWGDDIIVYESEYVTIKNCEISEGGRQGISICELAKQVIVENCYIHDVTRTAPKACIDVESNIPGQDVNNVIIRNCIFNNPTAQGIQVGGTSGMSISNILIKNNKINARVGCSIHSAANNVIYEGNIITGINEGVAIYGTSGNIIFRDNVITCSGYSAFSYKTGGFSLFNNTLNGKFVYDTVSDIISEVKIIGNIINGTFNLPLSEDAIIKDNYIFKIANVSGAIFSNNVCNAYQDATYKVTKIENNDITVEFTDDNHYLMLLKGNTKYVNNNKLRGTGNYKLYALFLQDVPIDYIYFNNNEFILDDIKGSVYFDAPKLIGKDNIIDRNKFDSFNRMNSLLDTSEFLYSKKDGTSENRPILKSSEKGKSYFDISLNKPIYWTGTKWIDATGADV